MKKVLFLLFFIVASLVVNAQVDFMGIPVEGTASEMKAQLKKKGFREAPSIYDNNFMVGQFYNREVLLSIHVNNENVVYCISVGFMNSVEDAEQLDKISAIRLFNDLLSSFDRNAKYEDVTPLIQTTYPEMNINNDVLNYGENLWHKINSDGVNYHSYYRQLPKDNLNSVHFGILPDNLYDRYGVIIWYENLKNRKSGDEDL